MNIPILTDEKSLKQITNALITLDKADVADALMLIGVIRDKGKTSFKESTRDHLDKGLERAMDKGLMEAETKGEEA